MTILFKKGFTLAEIMISVAIVSVIMTTVLFGYNNFSDRLSLSSSAQEIAIAIRQAQSYGLTVKESATAGQFTSGFGIYFDMNSDPTHYYLFVDSNANYKYDVGSGCGSGSTECVEVGTLRNNVTITNFCDATNCPPAVGVKIMSVTFIRPNPDAAIYFYATPAGSSLASPSATGKVTLTSRKGVSTNVVVESTGQISIQ